MILLGTEKKESKKTKNFLETTRVDQLRVLRTTEKAAPEQERKYLRGN